MVPVLDNQEIRAFTEDFGSFLQKKGMLTKFRIGVGNVFTDLKQLRNSVESAQEAIRIGVAESSDSVFHIYDDMIMLRLFEKFEDREELIEIAEFTLKELLSKQNEELLLTLRQFIKCGFRAKLAAEQLYIHENTMHYRLKKIASILKVDLKNYHDLFRLTLAVEIVQMYITPLDGKGGNADSNAQK